MERRFTAPPVRRLTLAEGLCSPAQQGRDGERTPPLRERRPLSGRNRAGRPADPAQPGGQGCPGKKKNEKKQRGMRRAGSLKKSGRTPPGKGQPPPRGRTKAGLQQRPGPAEMGRRLEDMRAGRRQETCMSGRLPLRLRPMAGLSPLCYTVRRARPEELWRGSPLHPRQDGVLQGSLQRGYGRIGKTGGEAVFPARGCRARETPFLLPVSGRERRLKQAFRRHRRRCAPHPAVWLVPKAAREAERRCREGACCP